MGDGIQRRYAIIINGDTERRHLNNVDRAAELLKKEEGYQVHVASRRSPKVSVDRYLYSTPQNIKKLIGGLRSKLDDDDLLMVYMTGHGDQGKRGKGCAALEQSCYEISDLKKDLETLRFGKRVVFSDMCYSGNSSSLFTDAKTVYISLGSRGEQVACSGFSPYFWARVVPEQVFDGVTTLEERYQYGLSGQVVSQPQFRNPMKPFSLSGEIEKPSQLSTGITKVQNGAALRRQITKLKKGQKALVMFSADWCGVCTQYRPNFERLAQRHAGKFMFIEAFGINGSEDDWAAYGVNAFPTLMFLDAKGNKIPVHDRRDPMASLPGGSMELDTLLQTESPLPEEKLIPLEKRDQRAIAGHRDFFERVIPVLREGNKSLRDRKVKLKLNDRESGLIVMNYSTGETLYLFQYVIDTDNDSRNGRIYLQDRFFFDYRGWYLPERYKRSFSFKKDGEEPIKIKTVRGRYHTLGWSSRGQQISFARQIVPKVMQKFTRR